MPSWIQGIAILRHRTSDVNRLRHWGMYVQTSYICPRAYYMMYPARHARIAYVTITIMCKVSPQALPFPNNTPVI